MVNENINIPNMTVGAVTDVLVDLYSNAVEAGVRFKEIPTPFLWGPPGVGKSQGVAQLAKRIEAKTGRHTVVTDIRLLLFSPVDLRGLPFADEKKEFANWLRPKVFDLRPDDDFINILFLDELSAAPQSVQASAYQICLDRKIGEHTLPENCIVIAAGNRYTDQSVSYKMPKALCNRLMHFNICADYNAWRNWAVKNDISNEIITFLAFSNASLCVEPSAADLAYGTPRSWEFVSTILKTTGKSPCEIPELISACVGRGLALEFETFCKNAGNLPDINDIIIGRNPKKPRTHDALYTVLLGLEKRILNDADTINEDELENVINYIKTFPKDFLVWFVTDLSKNETIEKLLCKTPGFPRLFNSIY